MRLLVEKVIPEHTYARLRRHMNESYVLQADLLYYGTPPTIKSVCDIRAEDVKPYYVQFFYRGYSVQVAYPPHIMEKLKALASKYSEGCIFRSSLDNNQLDRNQLGSAIQAGGGRAGLGLISSGDLLICKVIA